MTTKIFYHVIYNWGKTKKISSSMANNTKFKSQNDKAQCYEQSISIIKSNNVSMFI